MYKIEEILSGIVLHIDGDFIWVILVLLLSQYHWEFFTILWIETRKRESSMILWEEGERMWRVSGLY